MNIKTMACAAFMVSVAFAAAAADKVWTGAGGDGKWSNPANWEGVAAEPALVDGDTVVFTNDSAVTYATENNFEGLSLAAIVALADCTVTVDGQPLTLSGATSGTYKNHCIYNRSTSLTLNVPITVSKSATIDFNGKSTTLNGDVSLADDVTLKFAHVYAEAGTVSQASPIHFYGKVTGANATLNVDVPAGATINFYKPVTVKSVAGGGGWGHIHFLASNNEYGSIVTRWTNFHFDAAGAADPDAIIGWSTAGGYDAWYYGAYYFAANQTFAGVRTYEESYQNAGSKKNASTMYNFVSDAGAVPVTLTLAPREDLEAMVCFGHTDTDRKHLSLVYDPVVDCTQTVYRTTNPMDGTITVKGGTFKTLGDSTFPNLTGLTLEGGVFESVRTNAVVEFSDKLKQVRVGKNGTLRVTSTCGQSPFTDYATALAVNQGGKIEIDAGVTLKFASCSYSGIGLLAGTTCTSATCDWIVGDGAIEVSDDQTGQSYWKDNQGGLWSEGTKWSLQPPTAADDAYVAAEGASYTVGLNVPTLVPAKLFVENRDGEHETTLKVTTDVAVDAKDVTVSEGGRFFVDGATYAQTNGTFKVEDGGLLEIAGGTFRYSDNADNSKRFQVGNGGKVKMTGGTLELPVDVKSANLTPFGDGSEAVLSGDAVIRCAGGVGQNQSRPYFYGSLQLSGSAAYVGTYLYFYGGNGAGVTNYLTFTDAAGFGYISTPVLYLGESYRNGGWLVADFDTTGDLSPQYGYQIGMGGNTILNIHGKANMAGKYFGFQIGTAHKANEPHVVIVNVYDGGQIYHPASQNYANSVYGITVCDGVSLNVGPGGAVTNGTSSGSSGNSGSHFLVGCGKADGQVVQTGGTIMHQDRYQPVVGGWGGTGRWIVSNGVTTVSRGDFYVGGIVTNVHIGFTSGANNWESASKWNNFAPNAAKGLLRVAGGTFTCANDLWFSADGTGTLEMGPAADASLTAKDIYFTNTVDAVATSRTTVAFTFGPEGTGKAVASGTVTIAPGTKLVVDYSAYTGSKGGFDLISAAAIEGRFADEDITFIGDLTKEHTLVQDGKRVRVRFPHGALLLVR